MACERCKREGKTKIIHFERCGRWDTRVYCAHTYARGKLIDNEGTNGRKEVRHVLSRHGVDPVKKNGRPMPEGTKVKHDYSSEEDNFILSNYSAEENRHCYRGLGLMKIMRQNFAEQFGWLPTANQIVGRYNRLTGGKGRALPPEREEEEAPIERGVPSLPVLKFMQDAGSDHA
jgi:hypothetical protein